MTQPVDSKPNRGTVANQRSWMRVFVEFWRWVTASEKLPPTPSQNADGSKSGTSQASPGHSKAGNSFIRWLAAGEELSGREGRNQSTTHSSNEGNSMLSWLVASERLPDPSSSQVSEKPQTGKKDRRSTMQADNPLRHAKHVFRITFALMGAIVALILGRTFFVPATWGDYGWYRGSNLAEQRANTVMHGGNGSCETCHDKEFKEHAASGHKNVRCESCHAPLALHVKADKKSAEMPRDKTKELCLRCHRKLDARPASFKQIDPREHVEEADLKQTDKNVCLDCHTPHSPI